MATEKRLIDAIALISKAQRMETTDNNGIPVDTYAVSVLAIEDAPTVDAVEVVRCKDCIHYDFGVCLKIYSDGAVSQYAWQARKPEDFCSYGERDVDYG